MFLTISLLQLQVGAKVTPSSVGKRMLAKELGRFSSLTHLNTAEESSWISLSCSKLSNKVVT